MSLEGNRGPWGRRHRRRNVSVGRRHCASKPRHACQHEGIARGRPGSQSLSAPEAQRLPGTKWSRGRSSATDASTSADSTIGSAQAAADDEAAGAEEEETRTTVMLQRIPETLDSEDVGRALNERGFAGPFTVHVVLPCGIGSGGTG